MPMEDHLLTEPATRVRGLDVGPEFVRLMNAEDARVAARSRPRPRDRAGRRVSADRLRRGGRLVYVGAGTSGRLGVLDAAECPPTFTRPPGCRRPDRRRPTALTRTVEGPRTTPTAAPRPRALRRAGDLVVGSPRAGARRTCWAPSRPGDSARRPSASLQPPRLLATRSTSDRAGGRPRSLQRLHAAEGRHGDQDGPQHALHRRDGAARQDARQPDGRPSRSNEKLRIRSRRMLRELAGINNDAGRARSSPDAKGRLKPALVVDDGGRRARRRPIAARGPRRPGPRRGRGRGRSIRPGHGDRRRPIESARLDRRHRDQLPVPTAAVAHRVNEKIIPLAERERRNIGFGPLSEGPQPAP